MLITWALSQSQFPASSIPVERKCIHNVTSSLSLRLLPTQNVLKVSSRLLFQQTIKFVGLQQRIELSCSNTYLVLLVAIMSTPMCSIDILSAQLSTDAVTKYL